MIVMTRYANEAATYAPFYVHTINLVQPHLLVDAERFNIQYTDASQIENTPDRLRWYRYKKGLLQRDVADYAGIHIATYKHYESGDIEYYPIEVMGKVAELLGTSVVELLDEYNLFLYYGQGQQIKLLRRFRNMTQVEYAQHLGVPFGTLQQWEQDRVRLSKRSWELLKKIG